MNGKKLLIDSNVIIYASKGLINIDNILSSYDDFYISIITYMEVMGFDFENEKEFTNVKKLLGYFKLINVNIELAEIVINIRKKRKIKLPDAIILATAKFIGSDLVTENIADFKNIYLSVNLIKPI